MHEIISHKDNDRVKFQPIKKSIWLRYPVSFVCETHYFASKQYLLLWWMFWRGKFDMNMHLYLSLGDVLDCIWFGFQLINDCIWAYFRVDKTYRTVQWDLREILNFGTFMIFPPQLMMILGDVRGSLGDCHECLHWLVMENDELN